MSLLGTILGTDQQKRALSEAESITRQQAAAGQAAYQNYLAQAMGTLQPYQQAAQGVLPQMQQLVGQRISPTMTGFNLQDYFNDPSYQFQLQQGQQGINQAAAARGNFFAPATMQALGAQQQGLAATGYQDAFNRYLQQTQGLFGQQLGSQQQMFNQLANIYGIGAGAAGQMAGMQMGTGQAISGMQLGLGSELGNLALARGQINPWRQALQLGASLGGAFMNPAAGATGAMSGAAGGAGMTGSGMAVNLPS